MTKILISDENILVQEFLLQNKKILVVDDYEETQELTKIFLEFTSANIFLAQNGKQAVDCVMNETYDLILMDMQMPVMDGYSAILEIRKMGITTPIIAVTGLVRKEDEKRCFDVGCDAHLAKPYNRLGLIRSVYDTIV